MTDINLYIAVALAFFGVAFHFVTKLYELEQSGVVTTPWAYWAKHPYATVTVVMSTALMLLLQYYLRELTYSAALLTGIASNSLGDKLRAKAMAAADRVSP